MIRISILPFFILLLTACATSTPSTYNTSNVGRTLEIVDYATVTSIKETYVDKKSEVDGVVLGSVLGGAAGSTIGSEPILGAVGGVIVGAMIGQAINNQNKKVPVYEIGIRLEKSAKEYIIIQGREQEFYPYERVRILKDAAGRTIIAKI